MKWKEGRKEWNLKSEASEGLFDLRFRGARLNPKSLIRIQQRRRTSNPNSIPRTPILVGTISMADPERRRRGRRTSAGDGDSSSSNGRH